MISEQTLARAVATGVLSLDQAQSLRRLEGERAAEPRDEETIRFITGFADIFVTIGLALFLGALAFFGTERLGGAGTALILAGVSWLLAEFFTRRRRMALPSIALLLAFTTMVSASVWLALGSLDRGGPITGVWSWFGPLEGGPILAAALAGFGAAVLHYRRFRVPITVAAGVAALVGAVFGLLLLADPELAATLTRPLLLLSGLAVFALAMRFDMSDPQRLTRRTDIAFWLHLLAAPLIVHPLVGGLLTDPTTPTRGAALAILAIFAALAVVALLVDRRAVLVSGLSYAGFAFGSLVTAAGLTDDALPLTVLALGALVLALSAGWHALRGALLRRMPATLAARLPRADLPKIPQELNA